MLIANDLGSFDASKAPLDKVICVVKLIYPLSPLKHMGDDEGEISLCTLSAINWGNIRSTKILKSPVN